MHYYCVLFSVTVHKAFVPVHFYGQLVKQEEGCYLLRSEVYTISVIIQPHHVCVCVYVCTCICGHANTLCICSIRWDIYVHKCASVDLLASCDVL